MEDGQTTGQTVVKVTNPKLSISTFWSMDKFEDRLLQMRDLFQVGAFLSGRGEEAGMRRQG